jgi:transcriptional regulator with XRE-family HTH domain
MPRHNIKYVTNLVKQLRASTGMTQAAFARELHISTALESSWENRRIPTPPDLIKLSAIAADYRNTDLMKLLVTAFIDDLMISDQRLADTLNEAFFDAIWKYRTDVAGSSLDRRAHPPKVKGAH